LSVDDGPFFARCVAQSLFHSFCGLPLTPPLQAALLGIYLFNTHFFFFLRSSLTIISALFNPRSLRRWFRRATSVRHLIPPLLSSFLDFLLVRSKQQRENFPVFSFVTQSSFPPKPSEFGTFSERVGRRTSITPAGFSIPSFLFL